MGHRGNHTLTSRDNANLVIVVHNYVRLVVPPLFASVGIFVARERLHLVQGDVVLRAKRLGSVGHLGSCRASRKTRHTSHVVCDFGLEVSPQLLFALVLDRLGRHHLLGLGLGGFGLGSHDYFFVSFSELFSGIIWMDNY